MFPTKIINKPRPVHSRLQRTIVPSVPRKSIVSRYGSYGIENVLLDASYLVGKGIILFTMFYCSLNWLHYKRMREDQEKDDKDNKL